MPRCVPAFKEEAGPQGRLVAPALPGHPPDCGSRGTAWASLRAAPQSHSPVASELVRAWSPLSEGRQCFTVKEGRALKKTTSEYCVPWISENCIFIFLWFKIVSNFPFDLFVESRGA